MGFDNLLLGFSIALTPFNIFVAVMGIMLGTIIGVLPGLGGANGVAILLPLTFTMPPTSAIILLTSIYWGALFGGAITSILFNIPGEPWSVATTFDGYPLARQGQGGQALTAAFTSSFVGALFSIVLITLFAPLLAEIALKFGPPEFFAIQLLTFSSFVGLGGGNPLKSLVSILLGFILAAVGLDIVTGQLRMTFGSTELMKGFDFIVAVIGLFGIGEILLSMEEGLKFHGARTGMNLAVVLETWRVLPRYWRTFVRGSFIGFWMGFKPGGATPASFMSYAFAKRFSGRAEHFGKGELEGVVAPETAAHAAGVAAMLPMITLGIPGSPTAAVMLGGLIIWGLQPGPMLFQEKPDFVWGLIASMYTGNVIGVLMVLAFVPLFAAILRIPFAILTPLIVVVCAIGAYAVHNSMMDMWYMLMFGVMGYAFKKLDYPLAPWSSPSCWATSPRTPCARASSCPRARSASSSRGRSPVSSWWSRWRSSCCPSSPPGGGAGGAPRRAWSPPRPVTERATSVAAEREGGGMELAPIKSTRIYEEIVRQVKAMIAEGRLKGGDRLPPERDLAEKFVVSRTSVREALRALESLGLVEIRAGEGTFIRQVSVEALVEPLALLMVSQREATGELFEARRLLEPALAALAASRATPEEIQEMERILEEQAREVAGGRTGLAQDAQFHAAIGTASHNRAMTRIAHAIIDLLSQSREDSLNTPGRPTHSHQSHRRILAAISGRDAEAARQAMVEHIEAVESLVLGAEGADARRTRPRP